MKRKIIKRLYGGDAMNKDELTCGDCMCLRLLNEAIIFLALSTPKSKRKDIKIKLTKIQIVQLSRYYDVPLLLLDIPYVNQIYNSNSEIQKGIVKCGTKQINIYTYKN